MKDKSDLKISVAESDGMEISILSRVIIVFFMQIQYSKCRLQASISFFQIHQEDWDDQG
jgi:hypothetical protein